MYFFGVHCSGVVRSKGSIGTGKAWQFFQIFISSDILSGQFQQRGWSLLQLVRAMRAVILACGAQKGGSSGCLKSLFFCVLLYESAAIQQYLLVLLHTLTKCRWALRCSSCWAVWKLGLRRFFLCLGCFLQSKYESWITEASSKIDKGLPRSKDFWISLYRRYCRWNWVFVVIPCSMGGSGGLSVSCHAFAIGAELVVLFFLLCEEGITDHAVVQ